MARALASGRPTVRPYRAAASSSEWIFSALFSLMTTMLGLSLLFPPPLWGRVREGGEPQTPEFVIPPLVL